MTLFPVIFYIFALVIVMSTLLAVTRKNMVHAVIYLIISFFGSAGLFYLMGAPLLAALEIIIYAGAIMILFLFIVMMLRVAETGKRVFAPVQWIPAAMLSAVVFILMAYLCFVMPGPRGKMGAAVAEPGVFGLFLFQHHWLSIEIVSLLLLVAAIGALYLGRHGERGRTEKERGAAP
jgi:NADH-quinone oxidoreductase subunit J